MKLKIEYATMHRVNHETGRFSPILLDSLQADIQEYLQTMLEKIKDDPKSRDFYFPSETTEVQVGIRQILEGDISDTNFDMIILRLLRCEANAHKKIIHLEKEIPIGILIQVLASINGIQSFVLVKADQSDFIDQGDLNRHSGLPIKKKVYKAAIAKLDENGVFEDVKVLDSSSRMARYWWGDFLELVERRDDDFNTTTAFKAIDGGVLSQIKKKYRADHTIIRNTAIRYFRTNQQFEIEDFINSVIGDYSPVDPDLNPGKLKRYKEMIRSLPQKRKFDPRFDLVPQAISARQMREIVALTPEVDLTLKRDIPDLENTIEAVQYHGMKYLKIRSDIGYEKFKRKNNS